VTTRARTATLRSLRLVLLLAGIWAGGCGTASGEAEDAEATHDHSSSTGLTVPAGLPATDHIAFYSCVMHPHVRSQTPDQCPICGMDLVPVVAEGSQAQASIDRETAPQLRLTPRSAALLQLDVHRAERRAVEVPVRLFGRLDHDESRLRTIAAWVAGRIERLHVDFTGAVVAAGQPLLELYSPTLIAAQEELLQALQAERALAQGADLVRESARLTVAASRDRLRLLGFDTAQIELLESRGTVDDRVTIPAPVSGIVMERLAAAGDYVDTGTPIYRLADLSRLWAQFEVYESDLRWLAPGQRADFTAQSHPGERFEGTVSFIDPVVDERTRTARVRVDIANPDGRLKPGTFVRGSVTSVVRDAGDGLLPLLIPASAPLLTGRRAVVYVQLADADQPTYEPRDVLLGPRAGAWYVVLDGLREGELVVSNGAFKIDAELQIRGQSSMMQPAGGAAPGHDHGGQQ
jgi:membrane fusion protein, copper/silver efflux system